MEYTPKKKDTIKIFFRTLCELTKIEITGLNLINGNSSIIQFHSTNERRKEDLD